jgi:hypothetical protein
MIADPRRHDPDGSHSGSRGPGPKDPCTTLVKVCGFPSRVVDRVMEMPEQRLGVDSTHEAAGAPAGVPSRKGRNADGAPEPDSRGAPRTHSTCGQRIKWRSVESTAHR